MDSKWVQFLDWLERLLTRFALSFGMGYLVGQDQKIKIEAENARLRLELKDKENKDEIEKRYSNSSDIDVVLDAIDRGHSDDG